MRRRHSSTHESSSREQGGIVVPPLGHEPKAPLQPNARLQTTVGVWFAADCNGPMKDGSPRSAGTP